METVYRIFRFMGSLKMAVFVISALAIISAIGTFYESRYNAEFAQKIVYQSVWMYGAMILFCVSLIFSAVERLPWKKRHIPFLVAHIGLLTLVFGSLLTQRLGVDGSLSIPVGKKSSLLSITDNDLSLYASTDGDNFTVLFHQNVDFISNDPADENLNVPIESENIKVKSFFPFAVANRKIVKTEDKMDRPALRFLLKNANASFSDWLVLDRPKVEKDLGPVTLFFSKTWDKEFFPQKNSIYFYMKNNKVAYKIFQKLNDREVMTGELALGKPIVTPWMSMDLSLLNYYENAQELLEYEERDFPSGKTVPAILLEYKGKDYWLGFNSIIKFFTNQAAYILSWGSRQMDLGFNVELIEFIMEKQPGTNRAASYASRVRVDGIGEQTISMNEPLKYKGYTLYQASFQQDEMGKPVASILSVNHDPGRVLKYLGSLLVVLGSILLFYFRRQMNKTSAKGSV